MHDEQHALVRAEACRHSADGRQKTSVAETPVGPADGPKRANTFSILRAMAFSRSCTSSPMSTTSTTSTGSSASSDETVLKTMVPVRVAGDMYRPTSKFATTTATTAALKQRIFNNTSIRMFPPTFSFMKTERETPERSYKMRALDAEVLFEDSTTTPFERSLVADKLGSKRFFMRALFTHEATGENGFLSDTTVGRKVPVAASGNVQVRCKIMLTKLSTLLLTARLGKPVLGVRFSMIIESPSGALLNLKSKDIILYTKDVNAVGCTDIIASMDTPKPIVIAHTAPPACRPKHAPRPISETRRKGSLKAFQTRIVRLARKSRAAAITVSDDSSTDTDETAAAGPTVSADEDTAAAALVLMGLRFA